MKGPWQQDDTPLQRYEEYLRRRGLLSEDQATMTIVPIQEEPDLQGVLFLPDPAVLDGVIELYVRHIYVNRDASYISEPLRFIRGIVDHRILPLTLSRESVVQGSELARLHSRLRQVFLDHLKFLGEHKQRDLQKIVQAYGRQLKMAAVEDEELLDIVGDLFTIRVGLGAHERNLGQIVERHPDLVYMDNPAAQGQYAALHEAQGIPVVDASDNLDFMILHQFAEARGKAVARADTARIEEVDEPGWERVEHIVEALDDSIQLKKAVLPEKMAALFQHSTDDVLDDWFREATRQGGELSPEIKELKQAHELWSSLRGRRKTLYLNVRHPLLEAFRTACSAGVNLEVLEAVAKALIASARLRTEHLDASACTAAYDAQSHACAVLLGELLDHLMAEATQHSEG
jgi:HSP90 family molecular chaperone